MAIANDLHMLFKAWREAFEIVDRHTIDADLHRIVEDPEHFLYPIQFDKGWGKHNLIVLIMDNANYTERFGVPFSHPKRPAIYNKSTADSVTVMI